MKPGIQFLVLLCMVLNFIQAQGENPLFHSPQNDTLVAASEDYSDPSIIKCLLLGKNYRNTWATPVRLPLFHLSNSSFQIERVGGSKQTNSLYLVDKNDAIWVLRSVDKDVSKAYPS